MTTENVGYFITVILTVLFLFLSHFSHLLEEIGIRKSINLWFTHIHTQKKNKLAELPHFRNTHIYRDRKLQSCLKFGHSHYLKFEYVEDSVSFLHSLISFPHLHVYNIK